MSDILIFAQDGKWFTTDQHGTHPVTFELSGSNWQLTEIAVGYDAEPGENYVELEFELYNRKFEIKMFQCGNFKIHRVHQDAKFGRTPVKELYLPEGSSFTSFFKKTGKHVTTGEKIKIPIYHTFDKQIYG